MSIFWDTLKNILSFGMQFPLTSKTKAHMQDSSERKKKKKKKKKKKLSRPLPLIFWKFIFL